MQKICDALKNRFVNNKNISFWTVKADKIIIKIVSIIIIEAPELPKDSADRWCCLEMSTGGRIGSVGSIAACSGLSFLETELMVLIVDVVGKCVAGGRLGLESWSER